MAKIKTFLFSIHRISGVIISILFLMWFISGLVLIYHSFPNVEKKILIEKQESLPLSLPPIDDILSRLHESKRIPSITISQKQGQTLFQVRDMKHTTTLCADSMQEVSPITSDYIFHTAKRWVNSIPIKVDTLNKRDIWIMYSTYLDKMPIYKFYYDDPEKHQLYISGKTGEVQQFTTRNERIWAYIGAIPHKLYFPFLRQHTELWLKVITTLGFIGVAASLTGLIWGCIVWRQRSKRTGRILSCPYKKTFYKWHYICGLFFGLFLMTWAFSGAMAMQKIPQWIIKTYGDYRVSEKKVRGKHLSPKAYKLDYRKVVSQYKDVKEISWSNFGHIPIYNVKTADSTFCIDASREIVQNLYIPKETVTAAISKLYGDSASFRITMIDKYEEYYFSRKEILPLPVYKITIDNKDKSRFYINPRTGEFKYYNRARMAKKWIFSGLHYLNINWLCQRPVIWTICIWFLVLGGSIVTFTGVWLSIKYIRRIAKSS